MKKLIPILMLAAAAIFLGYALSGSDAANRDYVSYWASGRQLLHHQNPYDATALLAVERSAGFRGAHAEMMRNLPSALWIALPPALLPARLGAVLWSLGIVALLMASIRILWTLEGRPPNRLHLIGYLFPPALATILAGQSSAFLLFGICVFLAQHKARPFVAGAALALCTLKPHLFLPLAIVFLLWTWRTRCYRALAGAAAAFAVMAAGSLALRPSIWLDYHAMMGAENLTVPTLSGLLRALHPQWPWLQFVPAAIACIWAAQYFRSREWDWRRDGSLLLLVCVLTAPYAWFTDEAVLLPAMLYAFYRASHRALLLYLVPCSLALVEVMTGVSLFSLAYVWTPLAWLGWYLWSSGSLNGQSHSSEPSLKQYSPSTG